MTAKKLKKLKFIVINVVLTIFLLFTLIPVYVMIVNSFKTQNQLLDNVLVFTFPLYFRNYADAFERIFPYIWNSVTVAVVSTVGITFIAALTGYAFGHFEFRGKKLLFTLIIVNMMIPSILTLVPSSYFSRSCISWVLWNFALYAFSPWDSSLLIFSTLISNSLKFVFSIFAPIPLFYRFFRCNYINLSPKCQCFILYLFDKQITLRLRGKCLPERL